MRVTPYGDAESSKGEREGRGGEEKQGARAAADKRDPCGDVVARSAAWGRLGRGGQWRRGLKAGLRPT